MENFSNILSENPTYLIIAVVFSVVNLFSLAKKLLKITLVVLSVFILWKAYTIWTGQENSNAVTEPVYPVYVDSNVMTGRTGDSLVNGTYKG